MNSQTSWQLSSRLHQSHHCGLVGRQIATPCSPSPELIYGCPKLTPAQVVAAGIASQCPAAVRPHVCARGFALNGAQGPFFNATITGSTKTTVTISGPAGFKGKVAMVRYGWDDMSSLFYGTQIAVCE